LKLFWQCVVFEAILAILWETMKIISYLKELGHGESRTGKD